MRELDNSALRILVAVEQSQYQPEAVGIARDELARRRIPVLSPIEYWQQFPGEWLAGVGFCYRCWADTTDESPGDTLTVNLIGSRLVGRHDRCTVCDSVVQTMWFCIVVPIVPLDRYRVIHLTSGKYIGRMLKKSHG